MDKHNVALSLKGSILLSIIPISFLAIFFILPVANIIALGLHHDNQWNLNILQSVWGDSYLRQVIWFTFAQAIASTALTLAIGFPIAYLLARYKFPLHGFINGLVTVPFVLPTVVVAVAFLVLLRPDGWAGGLLGGWWGASPPDLRGTLAAVLIAHVFYNVSVVVRIVGGLLDQLDPAIEDAAAVLGANKWNIFTKVTLPLVRPALISAALVVFLFTFTSFGVVLFLGGPGNSTLEVEIHRQTALLLNLPVAAALSISQLVMVAVLATISLKQQRGAAVEQPLVGGRAGARQRVASTIGERSVVLGMILVSLGFFGAPLLAMVLRSLRSGSTVFTLEWYRRLFDPSSTVLGRSAIEAVWNSLQFAAVATVVAVVVGLSASFVIVRGPEIWRRWFEVLLLLPLGVSAVTVGFGFIVGLDEPPLNLRNSWWLIPMAQALVSTPFVVRVLVPVLASIESRIHEAAAVLGASPLRTLWEVDLPLIGRAVGLAAGFAFAMSLGEFGATVFIARADTVTVPVAIMRLLGLPGASNYGQAMALSSILMALTFSSMLVVSKIRLPQVSA